MKTFQDVIQKEFSKQCFSKPDEDDQTSQGNNDYLNRKQACDFLGCSTTTLYNYQKNGLIPYYKLGKKIFYRKSEILSLMKIDNSKKGGRKW